MMGLDNPIHIAFLFFVVLLVFGAKRLPEIGRSLGTGMRGFKDSLSSTSAESPTTASRHELPGQTTSSVAASPLSPVPTHPAAAMPATVAVPAATTVAEPSQEESPPSAA
jgi:sec-independent protein translocase protein TatA